MKKKMILGVCLILFLHPLFYSDDALPRFRPPALITSAGQSAEVQLANVLAKRAGIAARMIKTAQGADLEGINTLILVLGVSLKGLGAAGIDMEEEKARIDALMQTASAQDCPILCLHLGGDARRGDLSDHMITACLPHAAAALVVQSGNTDGLFTRLCGENNIPLVTVDKTAHALEPLKTFFSDENQTGSTPN